jgi:hypothetical protein
VPAEVLGGQRLKRMASGHGGILSTPRFINAKVRVRGWPAVW